MKKTNGNYKVIITNIDYDLDDSFEKLSQAEINKLDLPSELEIEVPEWCFAITAVAEEYIANRVSDLTSWCVYSYQYDIVNT